MEVAYIVTLCFILCTIIICGYFGTKIYEFYLERKKSQFKDVKSEFISDMYKLQNKYSKRGEFDFSMACSLVITNFSMPDPRKPQTEYGKDLIKSIKKLEKEEEE